MAKDAASGRLDPDTWQCQLEELLALKAVYDDDFSLVAAPGHRPPASQPQPHAGPAAAAAAAAAVADGDSEDTCLDPEELLMAGPPECLTRDEPLDQNGRDAYNGYDSADGAGPCGSAESPYHGSQGQRQQGASMGRYFVAEALVHVEVPEGGLQLLLELPPPAPPPTPPPPPVPAAPPSAAAAVPGLAVPASGGNEAPAHRGRGKKSGGVGDDGRPPPEVAPSGNQDGDDGDPGRAPDRDEASWTAVGGRGRACGRRQTSDLGREAGGDGGQRKPAGGKRTPGTCKGPGGADGFRREDETAAGGGGGGGGGGGTAHRGRGRGRGGRGLHPGPTGEADQSTGDASRPAVDGTGNGTASSSLEGEGAGRDKKASPATAAAAVASRQSEEAGQILTSGLRPPAGATTPAPTLPNGDVDTSSPPTPPAAAPPATSWVPFGAGVKFLGPIRVTLTLPPTYPEFAPPAVTLQAQWLSPEQTAALVSELLSQWETSGHGGPVIFTWLDWLRESALGHLGVRGQLVLRAASGAERGGEMGPRAAAVAAAGPEGVALSLLRYSARRQQEKFNESNISCAICLSEHLGRRCVRLPECGDAFCGACLTTYLRTQLGEGAVDSMRCPAPSCRRQLPPYLLQQLFSPDEYARWEGLTLQRTLDRMEDLVYCPRCREACLEDKDHCTLCPKCFFSFCSLCQESWHPGSACLDPETRLALLEERRREGAETAGLSATDRARRELNRKNELKNLALLQTTAKQCPLCSMGVEKLEGCNKITCSYCGGYFCWKCNKPISGYEHFQQVRGQPAPECDLFEQAEIDRWNARWMAEAPLALAHEQRGRLVELMRQEPQARVCNCVVCGQRNVKEGGNNDIRCWSCNSHFCYLCRAWLRTKPGSHFGAGRCRQHSDD